MSTLQKRIFQALSLSLLLLIQFLSIQAERNDFADNAPSVLQQHAVIKQHVSTHALAAHHPSKQQPHKQKNTRKWQHVKHVSIKFSTPEKPDFSVAFHTGIIPRNFSYNEQYSFDFARDINPPPPKA